MDSNNNSRFECTRNTSKERKINNNDMKPTKQLFLLFVITGLFSLPVYAQDYSIKNRWNTKLSLSFNRNNEWNRPFIEFPNGNPFQARLNARAECNYGVLNWLEVGGYIGYIRYLNIDHSIRKGFDKRGRTIAPTFGVNVNVHLLPFWVKNKDCRWELYLTAKYGGAYLINYVPVVGQSWVMIDGIIKKKGEISYNPNRYRQIFGAGIGGGVYFWNLFGLYTEVMAGQYSYFPEACKSYYTVRVGIEFKFTSNKRKKAQAEGIH